MWRIDNFELKRYLDEIVSCDAFELHKTELANGKYEFYIPYMMNDALECYLILKNGTMTGRYDPKCEEKISVELLDTDQGQAAIFRQGEYSVFTIWYEESFCEQRCYRYDQIGHFWVEGEEHWRRLVYIIGTIYDKFNYMGERVCNEKERALMYLMEFAPFRYYSPIHDSLDAYYDETRNGLECIRKLAEEADDRAFLRMIRLYELTPFKNRTVRLLANALQSPGRYRLYQLIFEKVAEASSVYPEREYPDGLHEQIKAVRRAVQDRLLSDGYVGRYPLFQKENKQILAMEEHPFTILESEHYTFKVQYMVSEIGKTGKVYPLNAGFFRKRGNRGWIEKEESDNV